MAPASQRWCPSCVWQYASGSGARVAAGLCPIAIGADAVVGPALRAEAGPMEFSEDELPEVNDGVFAADEMEALAAGVRDLKVLKGWRDEVFGKDALELVEGKLAFAVQNGKLAMAHIDDMQSGMEDALATE